MDENLTRQVAHLARLELTDDEVRTFTAQLDKIIGYVQSLQSPELGALDTVEPLISPADETTEAASEGTFLRPDELQSPLPGGRDVLEGAPDLLDHGFKVPPIL